MKKNKLKVRILIVDIETSPIISYTWGLFDQNVALNQIKQDWNIISWAAKWLGEEKVFYADQRNAKNVHDDKDLLKGIWKLMDEADFVLGQNSKSFDIKKLNARFIMNEMHPPSSYQQIDTLKIVKKHFGMTSNKLEYLSKKLCSNKKSSHKKFSGFELWKECLDGNKKAWKELEKYNKKDVLATEELYEKIKSWDISIDFNNYTEDDEDYMCKCGSTDFHKVGFAYTSKGKYQRWRCKECYSEVRDSTNLITKSNKKHPS